MRRALVHPDDLERHAGKWMEAVATGKPHESEVRCRRSDGQYRWQLDRGVPLRDEDGNIVKWYGVTTDIEDRKRAEGQNPGTRSRTPANARSRASNYRGVRAERRSAFMPTALRSTTRPYAVKSGSRCLTRAVYFHPDDLTTGARSGAGRATFSAARR